MKVERKFTKAGIGEVLESLMYDAEDFGHNFIELRHLTPCETQDVIMGFDEARVVSRRTPGSRIATAQGVKVIQDGVLTFYPDTRNRRWAYMLDTPKNRKILAAGIVAPIVEVVDQGIKREIIALAEKEGFATEQVKTLDTSFDAYLNKGVPDEVLELNAELEELKKQLAAEKKKAKPLSGTKVAKKTTTEK
jgi:hypothetical protein